MPPLVLRGATGLTNSFPTAILALLVLPVARGWADVFRHVNGGATTFIGMDALDGMVIAQAQMCLADSTGAVMSNCIPLADDPAPTNLPSLVNANLNTDLKRMIAVLSGQGLAQVPTWYCPDWDGLVGACTEPAEGMIFNQQIGYDVGTMCSGSDCWYCASRTV